MLRLVLLAVLATLAIAVTPSVAQAATCSSYTTQAAAQAAADTVDADGDGIYCDSLPCPCSTAPVPAPAPAPAPSPAPAPTTTTATSAPVPPPATTTTTTEPAPVADADPERCTTPKGVVSISLSRTLYTHIRWHMLDAIRAGWPRVLVVNRAGADERRNRALRNVATRDGYDRDEYPPAVGRGRGPAALKRGTDPLGWRTNVQLVPSSENRSHGSRLGIKLRRYCSGTRFRYVFF